ncbi:hypothetical protein NP233_g3732 [Leucocoprinus birnbaumii]|uniref:CxC2-like cysteine cluster KDZ transposase-associated domain-containing protein n=1 Tax=Leucocoprinus birnbaumii TaxID=56174 RepID=A0AAD5VW02_9AGAR|nr:hypothetical protein NP233_g3732 [Leucocoprinus birnbaumii]
MAFTFCVLDDFHCHSLCSKSSAYDYFNTLRRHTNAVFPQLLPDCYHKLMLVMRFWRILALLHRLGVEHDIQIILDHCRPGSIAVWCPACPEIGFNVDPQVLELADNHIYSLILSIDGNFCLQLKKKNGDPDDKPLCGGNGYFIEDTAYLEYLKKVKKVDEVSLCSKLKVVHEQDCAKFKDTEVSGMVGTQCRHQVYLPQGMVDLTKGEVYAQTDYALAQGLGLQGLRQQWILITYDVWCSTLLKSYRKHRAQLAKGQGDLEKLSILASPDLLSEWKDMYETSMNEEVYSTQDNAPTQREKYKALVENENSEYGEAGFLSCGLKLADQLSLEHDESDQSDNKNRAIDLFVELSRWRSHQAALYPQLNPLPLINEEDIYRTDLQLPSSFSREKRHELWLTAAANVEKELRLGLAYNPL